MFATNNLTTMKIVFRAVFVAFTTICIFGNVLQAQDVRDYLTRQDRLPCLNKKFPVVAHVVQDSFGMANISEDLIRENMKSLDSLFAPICVSFEICEINVIPNFQYDTLNTEEEWVDLQETYHRPNRINLYFVQFIGFPTENDALPACGLSTQEGITQFNTGGIVMMKGNCLQIGARSLAHEMGHFFGLLNTYGDGSRDELVDGSNCETTGDKICDTPADPYTYPDPTSGYVDVENGCRFISGLTDSNGGLYSPHVGNIMSGYSDDCRCAFSHDQFLLMAANYLKVAQMW